MKNTISTIAKRLQEGNIGVMASDTLFGLMGLASSSEAVERIYEVKKRDSKKPCIILLSDIAQLDDFHVVVHKRFRRFLDKIWPGPVTVILRLDKRYAKRFEYLHRGTGELTFRLPDNERIHDVIEKTGPLVAPSANPEGELPAQNIDEVHKYFGDTVDVYLNQEDRPYTGKPSTIIKIKDHKINLIREGVVPFDDIVAIWTSLL